MSTLENLRRAVLRYALPILVLLSLLLGSAPGTYANIRIGGGGDVPFYARLERQGVLHDDDWAVIVFYRPPECIPANFNLLDFFDWAAFGCTPPTTDGFMIFEHGPEVDPAPMLAELHGQGAVPVWFVRWTELQAAIADDSLTIGELAGLGSRLAGSASFYHEILHPFGGSQHGKIEFNATGTLADGRAFQVEALGHDDAGRALRVRIVFR